MGNLDQVLRQEASALAGLASRRARRQSIQAEIVDGAPLLWHVLQIFPGMESRAMAYLASRRFGAYLPMVLERRSGMRAQRPMFPEYLFVLVSDIESHWRRLRSVPGVREIVKDGAHAAVLPDDWVEKVQGYELKRMVESGEVEFWERKKHKRSGQRARPASVELVDMIDDTNPVNIATMTCRSYVDENLDGIEALDNAGRVGVLHRALGLSVPPRPVVLMDAVPGA